MKPFLKWVGGKQKLLPKLYDNFPKSFKHYYEPFLGGGAVFLNLEKKNKHFYLSDLNKNLISCYTFIKDSNDFEFELFLNELKMLHENHSRENYYIVRESRTNHPIAEFLYLNKRCFNGLYRVNKQGKFNVPCGTIKNLNIENELINLKKIRRYLKNLNVHFDCHSFEKVSPQKGDFVYLDPPYFNTFNSYTKETFNQNALKNFCDELNHQGVFFLLSNLSCEDCEELYEDYFIENLSVQSNMGRKTQHELLIKNYYFDSKIFVP